MLENNKYDTLSRVLMDALEQASKGKGKERHATDESFEQQRICVMNRWLKGSPVAGALFQATKKCFETAGFDDPDRSIHELRGAINYIAAAIILLEEMKQAEESDKPMWFQGMLADTSKTTYEDDSPKVYFAPDHDFMCGVCEFIYTPMGDFPCKKCFPLPFKPHFKKISRTRYYPWKSL